MFKKKLFLFLIVLSLFVFKSSSVFASVNISTINSDEKISLPKKTNLPKYTPDEVLVKFKEDKVDLANPGLITFFREFNTRLSNNLSKDDVLKLGNIAVYKINNGKSVEEIINEVKNDPNVESVEPNYYSYPSDLGTNDTFKNNLWNLDNTGQTVTLGNGLTTIGTNGADIDLARAWNVSIGTSDIIVAVIDSGVAYDHPDLVNNMWDGTNCVDELGYAISGGCIHGYDFYNNSNNPAPVLSSHGTHIAGIIAGEANNSAGIAGIGRKVKIMALKCEDSNGSFDSVCIVKSIDFAIQNGAKVINASFGSGSFSSSQYDAISRFRAAGGIFVAGAGNESSDNETNHFYPSDYDLDNIISVAATDNNDQLADFSNYGSTSVDVGAPGVDIYSTVIYKKDYIENLEAPLDLNPDANSYWGLMNSTGSKLLVGDTNAFGVGNSYLNNSNNYITSDTVDLSGASTFSTEFTFGAVCNDAGTTNASSIAQDDYMALEVSSDGTNFTEISKFNELSISALPKSICGTDNCFNAFSLSLNNSYLNTNFKYRFHWVTDSSTTDKNGCYVYDIRVIHYPPNGANAEYDFLQGTSIATPHVAGLAAYLLSIKPTSTYSQIISNILTSGDAVASLSGKTSTGKRINAYNSVLALNPPTVPGAPTGVGTSAGDTLVNLNWTAPTDNGGAAITDYKIEYKLTTDSTWTTFTDGVSTNLNASVTSLTNDSSYDFVISAINSVGTGATSSVVTATPQSVPTSPTVPGAPTGVGTSAGDTLVNLNWTAPTDNGGAAITDYKIEYKLTTDSTWTTFTDGVSTNLNASVTSLTNDSSYDFVISAINSVGTGATSSVVTATPSTTPPTPTPTPTIPGPPTGLTTSIGNALVVLNWTAPSSDGGSAITDYIVEYKLSTDSNWSVFNDGVSTSTTATVTGLNNGVSYDFRVTAVNSVGAGTPPSLVNGTPIAPSQPSNNNSSPPGIPSCDEPGPAKGPDLFELKTVKGKVTLYYSPGSSRTTGYAVLYGFKKGDERFGALTSPLNNNSGIQNFTINDLDPKKTYYFKVAATSKCSISEWSNWVPVQANKKKSVYKYKTIIKNKIKSLVEIVFK